MSARPKNTVIVRMACPNDNPTFDKMFLLGGGPALLAANLGTPGMVPGSQMPAESWHISVLSGTASGS
jgi:hypothetical protein